MRRPLALLLAPTAFALLNWIAAGGVRADPPVPGEAPPFSAYDIALAEAGLPEGWKAGPSDPPSADEKAIRDEIEAIAKAKGEEATVVGRALVTADGKAVTVVLVDSAKEPKAFSTAVQESATKHGWSTAELGSPSRLAICAGPEDARAKALAAQAAYAVRMLSVKASSALEMRTGPRAYGFAKAALAIDGKHAPSHYVVAVLIAVAAQNKQPEAKVEDAIAHFKAALSKEATSPLSGDTVAQAYGELGGAYLNAKMNAEGRDALKEAVKRLPGSTVSKDLALTFRYNLACAHGRLKEMDEAFGLLTGVLEDIAKEPNEQLEELWPTDEDFTNLKADPRWAELTKKYGAKKDAGGGN